jgi:RHS repeat-associated protein
VFNATYDAWGRQTVTRNDIGFLRGYTGHEMMPEYGLINMNGRLYDPVLGRFLSPDNYVQLPDFSQSFNRYSYCLNNPLKYVDPSGELFGIDDIIIAAAFIGGVINVASNADHINGIGQFLGYFGIGAIAGGVGAATAGISLGIGGIAGGALSGLLSGVSAGALLGGGNALLSGGNILRSALMGAVWGGVSGAVIGAVVGGVSSYLKNENIWTGKSKSISLPKHSSANTIPDEMPTHLTSESSIVSGSSAPINNTIEHNTYELIINTREIQSYSLQDSRSVTFQRPNITGYNDRVFQRGGAFREFPTEFDGNIVKYGTMKTSGNSTGFIAPGKVNGQIGLYNISINNETGVVYHRLFYKWEDRFQIYIGKDKKFFYK